MILQEGDLTFCGMMTGLRGSRLDSPSGAEDVGVTCRICRDAHAEARHPAGRRPKQESGRSGFCIPRASFWVELALILLRAKPRSSVSSASFANDHYSCEDSYICDQIMRDVSSAPPFSAMRADIIFSHGGAFGTPAPLRHRPPPRWDSRSSASNRETRDRR